MLSSFMGREARENNMGASCKKDVAGETEAIRDRGVYKQATVARNDEQCANEAKLTEITLVLLELNGNPGSTFQKKLNLQQEYPAALREYICGLASLPRSWNRTHLHAPDLVLLISNHHIIDVPPIRLRLTV